MINFEDALEQPLKAKPKSVPKRKGGTRKQRWKSKLTRAKWNFVTSRFIEFSIAKEKEFDDVTVGELRHGLEELKERISEPKPDRPAYVVPRFLPHAVPQPVARKWLDLSEDDGPPRILAIWHGVQTLLECRRFAGAEFLC